MAQISSLAAAHTITELLTAGRDRLEGLVGTLYWTAEMPVKVDLMTPSSGVWNKSSHAQAFDYLRFVPSVLIRHSYEDFNEVQLLRVMLPNTEKFAADRESSPSWAFHAHLRLSRPLSW